MSILPHKMKLIESKGVYVIFIKFTQPLCNEMLPWYIVNDILIKTGANNE